MSQYCTQCGAENDNDAKFCKSCGLPLALKTEEGNQPAEQVEQSAEPLESKVEQTALVEPMKLSMLWIFPTIWMIYHFIFVMHGLLMPFELMPETIASSFGSGFAILLIPLLVTGIIRLVRKVNDTPYPNFVKHTFIGTIVMFFLVIAGHINTKMEQSAIDFIPPTPQDTPQDSYGDEAPAEAAEDISPERQKQLDDEYAKSKIEYEAQLEAEHKYIASIPSSEIIGTSKNMNSQECETKLHGQWLWDGNKNRWICHNKGENNNDSSTHQITASDLKQKELKYKQLGMDSEEREDYTNAAYYFTKAIELNPKEAWHYNDRGVAYFYMGQFEKAKADANKACKLGNCSLKKYMKEHSNDMNEEPAVPEYQGSANEY